MLRCERDGAVAWLTLDRPAVLNALSEALLAALATRLADLTADSGVHVVGLAGAGRAFSAGADVADFERLNSEAQRRRYIEHTLHCLDVVAGCPKPTVADVDGLALGGGCELALACDIVVASEHSEFGLPEAHLGVLPSYALTRGRTRLGRGALALLAFTGRRVDAAEATRLGVVDMIGADARAIAREIAANAPTAVQAAKRLLRDGGGLAAAADASVAALSSEDHALRVAAFRRRASLAVTEAAAPVDEHTSS